jgi:CRP/FNR family transcriptional regulator, cyclic AMP receptor protein
MFAVHMAGTDEIASVPLFESLTRAELEEIARWFEERTAEEGVRLCGEGASGYSFFVLTEGRAEVSSQGERLGELGPGDFFGEIAILDGGRRTATVTTTAPAKLLVMFGTEFRRLQQEQPAIASQIEDAMRLRVANAD